MGKTKNNKKVNKLEFWIYFGSVQNAAYQYTEFTWFIYVISELIILNNDQHQHEYDIDK